ncbi:MAG TPA: EAL domain-containing protein [Crinalium sp.]
MPSNHSNEMPHIPTVEPGQDVNTLISHELRTPLTSICGALSLLSTGELGSLSEEGQRLLKIAINNTNRLVRLANVIDQESTYGLTILTPQMIEQLHLENDLHQAIERQEIQLAYQPIFSTATGTITSIEALARWQHPILQAVPPSMFISLAERTGLIHRLSIHLLNQACQQLKSWQTLFPHHSPISINVNLSPLQLSQLTLAHDISTLLEKNNIEPQALQFEITETALLENYSTAIRVLSDLKSLGTTLYIDDFGTGHSSLSRLKDFPVDGVKIDRSFVHAHHWDIIETIIELATKLELDVVAEGVETPQELMALQRLGCHNIQGYLFSKPVNAQTATVLISNSCGPNSVEV